MFRDFRLPVFLFVLIAFPVWAVPNRLILPDKTEINITHLFVDPWSRKQGLSGVRPADFGPQAGALFVFGQNGLRSFWMPNTYFDLDIIFLDQNLQITHIARNIPHHPSKKGNIPRVPPRIAYHILEIRSRTPLAKKLKQGMKLQFKGNISLEQIQSNTRL